MIILTMIIGCILGAIIGINAPIITYTYSSYLAIAIIAALDSVFGAIWSYLNNRFNMKIFLSGFFGNAILAMLLTYLGKKLNIDISMAVIVVLVGRMFSNLSYIRRYYLGRNNKGKNNVEEEKLHWEETHEWYVDSNRILYPKEYLDNYYDEIKWR